MIMAARTRREERKAMQGVYHQARASGSGSCTRGSAVQYSVKDLILPDISTITAQLLLDKVMLFFRGSTT